MIGRVEGEGSLRKLNKRQSEDAAVSEESLSKIKLNEIQTECPRLSKCVPNFFCEKFRGESKLDQIVSWIYQPVSIFSL